MDMAYEQILFEVRDFVATITLNRPEVMNALSRQTYAELTEVLRACYQDPEVRVVLITGSGRAFCSGDDVLQLILGTETHEQTAPPVPAHNSITPAAEGI